MSLFKRWRQARTRARYQRLDLRIIEGIPTAMFSQILDDYTAQGWEVSEARGEFAPHGKFWQGKIRKGYSTLECEWHALGLGRITGPARIIQGLAVQRQMTAARYPQHD